MSRFYGEEQVTPEIRNLYDRLLNAWSADTCAPRMRDQWSTGNPTLGQCSITAFLVQDLLGGKVYGVPLPDGNYHCYNVVDGMTFDMTSAQFDRNRPGAAETFGQYGDFSLDYEDNPEQFREVHFAKEEKRQRYLLLKERLQ